MFDFLLSASGVVVSLVAAWTAFFTRERVERTKGKERTQAESMAKLRLREIGISTFGIRFNLSFPTSDDPNTAVAEQLLKEVEQGIVENVSNREGLSHDEVRQEVETKMHDRSVHR
jgi:hypothetical protein